MKKVYLWIALVAVFVIFTGSVIVTTVSLTKNSESNQTSGTTATVSRLTGKTIDDDKRDVVTAAANLLIAANGPTDTEAYNDLVTQITNGTAVIPEELSSKIRFVDTLDSDTSKNTVYQILVTLSTLAKTTQGSDTIGALSSSSYSDVIVDQEAGVAYAPMTLFVESSSGLNVFSLEFVYLNGQWVFSPYPTLDQMQLALIYDSAYSTDSKG